MLYFTPVKKHFILSFLLPLLPFSVLKYGVMMRPKVPSSIKKHKRRNYMGTKTLSLFNKCLRYQQRLQRVIGTITIPKIHPNDAFFCIYYTKQHLLHKLRHFLFNNISKLITIRMKHPVTLQNHHKNIRNQFKCRHSDPIALKRLYSFLLSHQYTDSAPRLKKEN